MKPATIPTHNIPSQQENFEKACGDFPNPKRKCCSRKKREKLVENEFLVNWKIK